MEEKNIVKKTIHFVAGLPRAGSTLFVNILNQNPKFHAAGSSGLVGAMLNTIAAFEDNPFFKAMPKEENFTKRKCALQGLLYGFYDDIYKPICFDKNRQWPAKLEMLKWLMGDVNVKVICCMRDMRDVLASFEVLYRKTSASGMTTQERANPIQNSTAIGRASLLMQDKEVVGHAKNIVIDAIGRGHGSSMYCLDYRDLCGAPEEAMKGVYNFLGYEYYDHDFNNVEAVTVEDDRVHGFRDLHKIRPKVEEQEAKWPIVYDENMTKSPFWQQIEKNATFWRSSLST